MLFERASSFRKWQDRVDDVIASLAVHPRLNILSNSMRYRLTHFMLGCSRNKLTKTALSGYIWIKLQSMILLVTIEAMQSDT